MTFMNMNNWDGKVPNWELEPIDSKENSDQAIKGIIESYVSEIATEARKVTPENPEQKTAQFEGLRAEIEEMGKLGGKTNSSEKSMPPSVKAEEVAFLNSCYDKVPDFPDKANWELFWVTNILAYGGSHKEIENFFTNISRSELLRDTLCTKDLDVNGSITEILMKKIFTDPKEVGDMVHNIKEKQKEKAKNELEKYDRITSNPYASDEEYRAGTYRESIESQVRDAVFELQKKGYSPMESGFNDLATGSQYIGISKEESVDGQTIANGINKNISEKIKKLFSQILVQGHQDRVQIILVPKIRTMPLGAWKTAWDEIVSCLPKTDNLLMNKRNTDNGLQGEKFREAQDKIKKGKNAWLSDRPELAFVDGKVVRTPYKNF